MYDDPWLQDYIDNGVITPESSFRKQLNAASRSEDLELYINSPGGSVFAGYEMLNDIRAWMDETGNGVSVTVGGLAASMGAYLATFLGPVTVHSNSKIMFHSAAGAVSGGPQAMEDEAVLLRQINAEVKTRLIDQYGAHPDDVETWFQEGRAGWLDANLATQVGLANKTIGALAAAPARAKVADEALQDQIAAAWMGVDDECDSRKTFEAKTNNSKKDGGRNMSKLQTILGKLGFGPQTDETTEQYEARFEALSACEDMLGPDGVKDALADGLTATEAMQVRWNEAVEAKEAAQKESAELQAKLGEKAQEVATLQGQLKDALERPHAHLEDGKEGGEVDIDSLHAELVQGGSTKTAAWQKIAADYPEEYSAWIAAGKPKARGK
jgi:ATP-dependent protease ClpP protease subunit